MARSAGSAASLSRTAAVARANAAVEVLADGAERFLALKDSAASPARLDANVFDFEAFAGLPEEIRVRLLQRAIDRFGHEGPAELGKVETLLSALDQTGEARGREGRPKLKQTLAGALISLADGRIRIEPAPPRRRH